MTIEDLKSWIKVINGLYFATCFICIGGFSYGFVPFSNKDTTINFCVALFFYAISILIIGNFISKEGRVPLINNKYRMYIIFGIIFLLHIIELVCSLYILQYNVVDDKTIISINYLAFVLTALGLLLPYGMFLEYSLTLPVLKEIIRLKKEDKENDKKE